MTVFILWLFFSGFHSCPDMYCQYGCHRAVLNLKMRGKYPYNIIFIIIITYVHHTQRVLGHTRSYVAQHVPKSWNIRKHYISRIGVKSGRQKSSQINISRVSPYIVYIYLYFGTCAEKFTTIKFASGISSRKTRILLVTKISQFRVMLRVKSSRPYGCMRRSLVIGNIYTRNIPKWKLYYWMIHVWDVQYVIVIVWPTVHWHIYCSSRSPKVSTMKTQCTVGHTITYLWAPNLFFLLESLRCFVSHWEVFLGSCAIFVYRKWINLIAWQMVIVIITLG